MTVDLAFGGRLRLPLIVAPMFLVSSPQMALAACARGAIGSFPAHSTRTRGVLGEWLEEMRTGITALEKAGVRPAPFALNLVVHPSNQRYEGDLALCIEHEIAVVLTSKGAPAEVFSEIHRYGGIAFHDVASVRHAEKALEAGADGLIAVAGGAGGHTGTINPFALLNEIRTITDGPIILSGAISTGRDILAAQAMGANMVYMGTRFINTQESLASQDYRKMVEDCGSKDVFLTAALDGAPANFLIPSLTAAGIDLDVLAVTRPGRIVGSDGATKRYSGIWSAGHGVGQVNGTVSTADLVDSLVVQYEEAKADLRQML